MAVLSRVAKLSNDFLNSRWFKVQILVQKNITALSAKQPEFNFICIELPSDGHI
jgi:uncharacterized protein with NRDE domain